MIKGRDQHCRKDAFIPAPFDLPSFNPLNEEVTPCW